MTIIPMRGAREAPKAERSRMETLLITPEIVQEWRIPPFQRPLRVNMKVLQIAEELKRGGGIIEGVISLGTVGSDHRTFYLYDGQHRIEAAKISELPEFIADVRICHFDTMAEMAVEFVKLNTQIARLRPDDVMRGMEEATPALRLIRKRCAFVGYDNVRRNASTPTLSMSAALRCWVGTTGDTPALSGFSAAHIAAQMTIEEAEELSQFLTVARTAWGSEPENNRLWGNLNLSLNMWLWRQLVKQDRPLATSRIARINAEQFKRCLMMVAASRDYVDWLVGRNATERDRSPGYVRLKQIFVARLKMDKAENLKLPSPAWASR